MRNTIKRSYFLIFLISHFILSVAFLRLRLFSGVLYSDVILPLESSPEILHTLKSFRHETLNELRTFLTQSADLAFYILSILGLVSTYAYCEIQFQRRIVYLFILFSILVYFLTPKIV